MPGQLRQGRLNEPVAWGIAVVSGLSMVPTYAPGDRLVVRYGASFTVGAVVLVDRGNRVDLKRIVRVEAGHVFVEGDNAAASTDSRQFGAVTADEVLAVVRWRLPRWLGVTGG